MANTQKRTTTLFNEKLPKSKLNYKSILELAAKFSETGSVVNKKGNNRRVLDGTTQKEVLGTFKVRKALKLHKFHPYRKQIFQQSFDEEFDTRFEF